MKFKIDENLPQEVADILIGAGYDAHTVHDENLRGSVDDLIAKTASHEQRVLITLDTDFANITAYPPGQHSGIVVIRAGNQDRRVACELITRLIPTLGVRNPARDLWIVEPGRIRIRHQG